MAWIPSYTNDATEQKMVPTQNGPNVFLDGSFMIAYASAGYAIGGSATGGVGDAEYSIFSGLNATSNANFTANTASVATVPSTMGYVNLSSDPTGKGPGSSLYLPGAGQPATPAPFGALVAGTWFTGRVLGKWNATSTPTFQVRVHLRSPDTGKVVYTIVDSTAFTTVAANNVGIKICPSFIVTTGGVSGTIVGSIDLNYGVNGYQSAPTITSGVDCTKSYILDLSVKWGTASASNTITVYGAEFELVG